MGQRPKWWCGMEYAARRESLKVATARERANEPADRDQLGMHEAGFRGAWLLFRETLPCPNETPDAYLARLAAAIWGKPAHQAASAGGTGIPS